MKRGELAAVLLFAAMTVLLFIGKAYHADEPLYLPAAWHILEDPLHPFAFELNYYGRNAPYREINNTPPLIMYVMAVGLKATGGREWGMRLFFLPFDLAAAAGLFFLAARFLSKPLLPVLIVLASPAYWINMAHLMPEKLVLAFGLWGLYGVVRWVEDGSPRTGAWYWASAGLMALATLSKYNAGVLLLAGAGYAVLRGSPWRRVAGWCCLGLSGLALYFLADLTSGGRAPGAAWLVTRQAMDLPTSALSHRLRSLLAFLGGGTLVAAAWPFLAQRPSPRVLALLGAAVLFLFSPFLDIGPVRGVDRLTGILLSVGSLWLFRVMLRPVPGDRARPGRTGQALWLPWLLAGLAGVLLYWSVMARTVLLMVPPAVFALATVLEGRLSHRRYAGLCLVSLVVTVLLGVSLAAVDYRYAASQRQVASEVADRYLAKGRKAWCAGHWGLQYYLERAGARTLDSSRGGWDEARPGDIVIVPSVNTNILRPNRRVFANVTRVAVSSPIPLRLICASRCEGGFYSNVMGFLPFSLSLDPVDAHEFVEVL
ncbi:MAG: glycosyltransferase family 39 protein [Elusimicrobia bacterium]|nr:glycosyltransferase family 39 protein [Elusimicrobiota bacterium]